MGLFGFVIIYGEREIKINENEITFTIKNKQQFKVSWKKIKKIKHAIIKLYPYASFGILIFEKNRKDPHKIVYCSANSIKKTFREIQEYVDKYDIEIYDKTGYLLKKK